MVLGGAGVWGAHQQGPGKLPETSPSPSFAWAGEISLLVPGLYPGSVL